MKKADFSYARESRLLFLLVEIEFEKSASILLKNSSAAL